MIWFTAETKFSSMVFVIWSTVKTDHSSLICGEEHFTAQRSQIHRGYCGLEHSNHREQDLSECREADHSNHNE